MLPQIRLCRWEEPAGGEQAQERVVLAEPHSELWRSERARRLAVGESVGLMDDWAKEGRGWEIKLRK